MTNFEQIYNTYFNDVFLYVRRLSGNEHTAEEITSDTFFKAMKSIDSFRGDCDVRVWLCQIAKNCYYSYTKKDKRFESLDASDEPEFTDSDESLEIEIENQEITVHIQKVLHEIGEPYKEVFMWRVYACLSFKEIASVFGKNDNWACVTYHRARKLIKQKLEENGYEK